MCNALSPEKAVIWSVLHGEDTGQFSGEMLRYAPYRVWFDVAKTLKAHDLDFSLENFKRELTRLNAPPTPKDLRALKRMLTIAPPARIRNNAQTFISALGDIQSGAPVHLHRFIN